MATSIHHSGSPRGDDAGSHCAAIRPGQPLPLEARAAARGFIRDLGPELRRRHGRRKHYSPAQVQAASKDRGLMWDWDCLAYCLYCSPGDFSAIHAASGEACDYGVLRQGIADTFFNGHVEFEPLAVAEVLESGAIESAVEAFRAAGDWLGEIDWLGFLDWS